jgi:hypothetical protein
LCTQPIMHTDMYRPVTEKPWFFWQAGLTRCPTQNHRTPSRYIVVLTQPWDRWCPWRGLHQRDCRTTPTRTRTIEIAGMEEAFRLAVRRRLAALLPGRDRPRYHADRSPRSSTDQPGAEDAWLFNRARGQAARAVVWLEELSRLDRHHRPASACFGKGRDTENAHRPLASGLPCFSLPRGPNCVAAPFSHTWRDGNNADVWLI